ncbi:heterokaryon incompatibility protein-domain-containing protein [Amylocarpus encephaloides]|uniref:Heterokaryon incompatibility protein-domain-containing protein n=1 Tax=Amylocarpus encephaloides TaxID=45428 RepID=A0A9P8C1G4_9HELO|nr:heterokaryon incompatibility protein-domain-containing protein [Amylocarpus encephaloides]
MAFNYSNYPLLKTSSIRLIQIRPREDDEDLFTDINLRMRVLFLIAQKYRYPAENPQQRLSRFLSKIKARAERFGPDKPVPLSDPPPGEPALSNRFRWGNYVAMSYAWGSKEGWEMDEEERARVKREIQQNPPDDDEADYTPALNAIVREVVIDSQRVRVRHNLWAALLRFRELSHFKQGVLLWNDALCINQNDLEEKTVQVQMMSEIYRQAGNIIIDVGDSWRLGEKTPWAIEYIQNLSVHYRTELYEVMDHADAVTAHQFRYDAKTKLEESAKAFAEEMRADLWREAWEDQPSIYLYDFFDRPYWRRLWIIQELTMAHPSTPIVCGGVVTQWRYIRDAAMLLSLIGDSVVSSMQHALAQRGRKMNRVPSFQHVAAIAQISSFSHRKSLGRTDNHPAGPSAVVNAMIRGLPSLPQFQTLQGSPITQDLMLAAGANCTYNKDRVHGLLAIPVFAQMGFNPSYDTPISQLYMQFAAACVTKDKTFDIFTFLDGCFDGTTEATQLPSWCPHFHFKNKIGRIEADWWHSRTPGSWQGQGNTLDLAFHDGIPDPLFRGNDLICYGWIVDSVDGLGALSESDGSNVRKRSLFQAGVLPPRFEPDWKWQGPESVPKCNWDFFQANANLEVGGKPLKSYFTPLPSRNAVFAGTVKNEQDAQTVVEAHQAMEARTKLRRLMTTSNRPFLGLVPATTRRGDAVILLRHHSRPLIAQYIIPDDTNESYNRSWFRLKGEAYIDGLLDGELGEVLYNTPTEPFVFR